MTFEIRNGDCLSVMPELSTVDAIVTDPPYGLAFMGKEWDHGVPGVPFWTEALRVLRPGGYLVAFGGTRTYHRLACAIEDGGFKLQDCLMWLHGQGFPKGKTQLKPAWEPILLAYKPGPRTLNVDGCRIGTAKNVPASPLRPQDRIYGRYGAQDGSESGHDPNVGRWPANVCLSHVDECRQVGTRKVKTGTAVRHRSGGMTFGGGMPKPPMSDASYADEDGTETIPAWECADGCPVRMLDEQSGERDSPRASGNSNMGRASADHSVVGWTSGPRNDYQDRGGASRFFYTAKADSGERHWAGKNTHPTVKPVDLMRWLCRLVTPKGGLILDPFMGSGSTGVAALAEGFRFVGIEKEEEYARIAKNRIGGPLFGAIA